jgi:diadenylate cyclase
MEQGSTDAHPRRGLEYRGTDEIAMNPFGIIAHLRYQDVLDILLLTVLTYHLYLWFSGTKALKALVGLLVLGVIYTVARSWGLFLTTWVFQIFWQVLVILLIILFQSEIRQVLERVNPLKIIGLRAISGTEDWVPNFVEGVFSLAERKIGALVIIERTDRVEELVTGGVQLDAEPSSQLLMSIFQKDSPLHDGAMLLRKGKVAQVACYLPLSSADGLPREWGTRHRAALGLTEHCDAWVVVVSEERGKVSLARDGQMTRVEQPGHLFRLVIEAVTTSRLSSMTWGERFRSFLFQRWLAKAGTFGLVSFLWLLLAGQQNFEVTFRVPVEMKNLPEQMEILEPVNPEVQITVRGLRKDASILSEKDVHVAIDLSAARFGARIFRITRGQIVLPNERVSVVSIRPPEVQFKIKEKQ